MNHVKDLELRLLSKLIEGKITRAEFADYFPNNTEEFGSVLDRLYGEGIVHRDQLGEKINYWITNKGKVRLSELKKEKKEEWRNTFLLYVAAYAAVAGVIVGIIAILVSKYYAKHPMH